MRSVYNHYWTSYLATYSSKINNFRTPITIFFLLNALPAVVSVCYTNVSTDNTTIFIAAVVAFVAYVNQGMGVYKGVADYTFSIAYNGSDIIKSRKKVFVK